MTTAAPPEKMTEDETPEDLIPWLEHRLRRVKAWGYETTIARYTRYLEQARRLAPRVGDAICPTCGTDNTTRAVNQHWYCKPCRTLHRAGTKCPSAPPAASADERADMERIIHEAFIRAVRDNVKVTEPIADDLLAAGYRKQGVGEFAAELVKWCEHISGGSSALRDVIRRLSALPKGQEHEG